MRVADGLLAVIGKIREHAVVENLSAFSRDPTAEIHGRPI